MKKRLNILNIGFTPPRTGGSAFVNIETMRGLAERGHRIRGISEIDKKFLENPNYDDAWKGTGIEIYPIEESFIIPSKLDNKEINRRQIAILDQFYRLVDDEKPDVLMVGHESYSFYANAEARKMGIPIVQVLHGTPTHMIDEGIYPDDLTKRFLDSINESTLVLGVSNYLAEIVRSNGIKQATYIHNGTDTNLFKPREGEKDEEFLSNLGLTIGDKVIMHASTLRPVKRPLDIVESAYHALQKNPDLKYVIVGDGILKEAMENRAKKLGIYDSFRFVGVIDHKNMPKFYQNADMFLLPSEHEGFGRVVREAQACKVPPVASNIGPMHEVIYDGETGYLHEKGNNEELADKTLALSQDEDFRITMGERAFGVAVANNLTTMVRMYEQALNDPTNYVGSVAS